MNAHWIKWVSVAALAVAGTLGVACGGDDDDDDNGGKAGKAGASGTGGSSGGGSGGSGGGGSGASGAGGGGLVLPPTDKTALKTALDAGNYLPEIKAAKWACNDDEQEGTNLGETTSKAHNESGTQGEATPARNCANFNLAGQDFKAEADGGNAAGWPLGAAALKETLDDDGNVVEIAYFALKDDGTTWYFGVGTPDGAPQAPGPMRNYTVNDGMGCAMCHSGADVVKVGNKVVRTPMLAAPYAYEQLDRASVLRERTPMPAPPPLAGRGRRAFVAPARAR
ncbi:MAG TPA: hypothetical protein VFS00_31545 [Polyangiaceae bacterium]|nr:hypothetical protein [Polyangiaceae bacterium]